MITKSTNSFMRRCLAACLAAAFCLPAHAIDVAGVKVDDKVHVGDADLTLNGAGVRYKAIFKVYTVGLYLTEKKTTTASVLASTGPRRIVLTMLRDISSDDFGEAFMNGVSHNSDKEERSHIINQMMRFGEMFAMIPKLKKGDVLAVDWLPGVGTTCQLNGKKVGETVPDLTFYNAILKIWIGGDPVDTSLKPKLLGGPA